jgi:hypothetical protein
MFSPLLLGFAFSKQMSRLKHQTTHLFNPRYLIIAWIGSGHFIRITLARGLRRVA